MLIVRDVFQAKYGKGGDLVELFKEARGKWPQGYAGRILSDASGPFFRVIAETEVQSLSDWEGRMGSIFSLPEFGNWFQRMMPLVESGNREFYRVE